MAELPRRKLEELVELYRMEPSLRDIYVEGKSDKRLVEFFLDHVGRYPTKVYVIDDLEIGGSFPDHRGRNHGNRSRIAKLADKLEQSLGIGLKIGCIIDRDFDDYLGEGYRSHYLWRTDYCCIESYLWSNDQLKRWYTFFYRRSQPTLADFIANTEQVLEELFLIRLVREKCAHTVKLVRFSVLLKNHADRLNFDTQEYINRLANTSHGLIKPDFFRKQLEDFRIHLHDDIRYKMHGHDLFLVFAHWTKRLKSSRIIEEDTASSAFFSLVDIESLRSKPLFNMIESVAQ